MVRPGFLRYVGRYSSYGDVACDAVICAAFCDAFSTNSNSNECLQSGDVPTGLSRFATVPAAPFSAELSGHPAPLSALRFAIQPCILPRVNLRCYALHAALMTPFQPANPLSFPLQTVSVSRQIRCRYQNCAPHRWDIDTTPLTGSCQDSFESRQIPNRMNYLLNSGICQDSKESRQIPTMKGDLCRYLERIITSQ